MKGQGLLIVYKITLPIRNYRKNRTRRRISDSFKYRNKEETQRERDRVRGRLGGRKGEKERDGGQKRARRGGRREGQGDGVGKKEKREGRGEGKEVERKREKHSTTERTWVYFHNMKLSVYFSLVCNNGTQHVRISSN